MRTPANSQTTRKPILILSLGLLVFSAAAVVQIPPRDQQQDPEVNSSNRPTAPKQPEQAAQIIHFATNRHVEYRDGRLTFGKQPGPLAIGKAHLIVGDGYQPGDLTHIRIRSLAIQGEPNDLNGLFPDANAKSKPVLVFVHGFYVEFEEAIQRVTQIVHELDYKGHVFVYTWPSVFDVTLAGYVADQLAIDKSVERFHQFLDIIGAHFGAHNVQLLAHSLGCRLIAKTIQSLQSKAAAGKGTLFRNLILVAPDIELDTFKQDYSRDLKAAARRLTIYFSSKDGTLALAEYLEKSLPRLGRIGLQFGVHAPIELVDYSALPGGILNRETHNLYRVHPAMVRDLRGVLLSSISSSDRKIEINFK